MGIGGSFRKGIDSGNRIRGARKMAARNVQMTKTATVAMTATDSAYARQAATAAVSGKSIKMIAASAVLTLGPVALFLMTNLIAL